MRMRWIALTLALVTAVAVAGCGGVQKGAGDNKSPAAANNQGQQPAQTQPPAQPTKKQWNSPPALKIDPNKQYFATIKTSLGDIRIELFAKDAPKTVNNFVFLAREGYYENVVFHRILKNFMVQTGDPTGTGAGGPGYRFEDELPPKRPYDLGIVAMANAGKNTNGSQFFICNAKGCGSLDQLPNYTQFGKVADQASFDTLTKLSNVEVVASSSGEKSKPVAPPTIKSVVIEEK